ncbi:MAG: PD40 domain-containing protein [Bacteroidetes bacterium]|nr:PD40 domain-containing protein [Bacteroidota bacterium]
MAAKLSDHVNDPSATNTHPSVGYDKSGNEVLFFSSNRNGGQGLMDIWISKRNSDGSYQNAVNATDINTKGNEVTPFYDVNAKKLYFSSDWLYGFGGYDIFETSGEFTQWQKPVNLMQPINTPQNDLYYSVALDNSKAYITSNRKGSYFIESETCCNDIYAYSTEVKKIQKPDTISVAKTDTPITVTDKLDTIPVRTFIDENVKKIKQLLPVTLYFHNDEPDARTLSDTTSLDYRQAYEAYSALRNEYEKQFSRTLKKEERISYEGSVKYLFEEKVDKGYYNLVAFVSQTLKLLEGGNKLEVTIRGYCSPLNYNEVTFTLVTEGGITAQLLFSLQRWNDVAIHSIRTTHTQE